MAAPPPVSKWRESHGGAAGRAAVASISLVIALGLEVPSYAATSSAPARFAGAPAAAPAGIPSVALAPAGTTGPAVGSWGDGAVHLFWRAGDATLAHQYLAAGGGIWSSPEGLGGQATSQPTVTSQGRGQFDVFVRGSDGALWRRSYAGSWSGWSSLGGQLSSAPAAASWGPGRLDVFARGTDQALWHRWWTGGVWSRWESLGGRLTAGPAVAAGGPNRLDVLVRGTDAAAWHRSYAGGRWSRWASAGGGLVGEPALLASAAGVLEAFGRGRDNALWTSTLRAGDSWSPWRSLGGGLSSGPAVTLPVAGQVDVFARGTDGRFWWRSRGAGGWSPWRPVDPAAAFRLLGSWVDRFDYGLDPVRSVADMRARGVRTLYLSTGRFDSANDFFDQARMAAWLAAAHGAGIRVVGWYVPNYANPSLDLRRTLAIARYVSPAGHRFDSLGIDIEYPDNVASVAAWNSAVVAHLAAVRAATRLPVGAIVIPPVTMSIWHNPSRWVGFPWSAIGRNADVVVLMNYWTGSIDDRCAAGQPAFCTYRFTYDNVTRARSLTGLPVHVVGGIADTAAFVQVSDYVRAARAAAAIGGGLYDYATTAPRPTLWSYLTPLNSL